MLDGQMTNGKWQDIKHEVLRTWRELSANEVDRARDDLLQIAKDLQKNFGYARDEVEVRLHEILRRHIIPNI